MSASAEALHTQGEPLDYEFFTPGDRNQARLIAPRGKRRQVKRPGDATGDLFAENGSSEVAK